MNPDLKSRAVTWLPFMCEAQDNRGQISLAVIVFKDIKFLIKHGHSWSFLVCIVHLEPSSTLYIQFSPTLIPHQLPIFLLNNALVSLLFHSEKMFLAFHSNWRTCRVSYPFWDKGGRNGELHWCRIHGGFRRFRERCSSRPSIQQASALSFHEGYWVWIGWLAV